MSRLKVAVYAIAKDEEKHAERFMRSTSGADLVLVADTGSSDGTVRALRALGADVRELEVRPWRFDRARNEALALLPADVDVCVPLDLDEVLAPGWRDALERAWVPGTNRLRYPYVWSHEPDGRPGISFHSDKVHGRRSHRWILPVHERLTAIAGERCATSDELRVDHWPDDAKSRSSYLPLLELAAREDPADDRTAHYLGRELMFVGRWADAIRELERHLALPRARWNTERCASMRFLGRCCYRLGRADAARAWWRRAVAEEPCAREPWVELARLLHHERDYAGAATAALAALQITKRPGSYICEPEAWGALPHDLASSSLWWLGRRAEAIEHARRAFELQPDDQRLRANVELLERLVSDTRATTNPNGRGGPTA